MATEYLKDRDIAECFSVGRATVWRWVKQNNFPKPIQLSPGCSRWRLEDVEKWAKEKHQK